MAIRFCDYLILVETKAGINLAGFGRATDAYKNVESLLIKYGPLAVFLAALIEADVVPIACGVVVHLGFMRLGLSLGAAIAGALVGDYVWFVAGRHFSKRIQQIRLYRRIEKSPRLLIQRLGLWQIPLSHLVYGTRVSTMIWWGIQRTSTVRFVLVDALGCIVSTSALFTLGFAFSGSSMLVIARVKQFELLMLAGVVVVLIVFSRLITKALSEPELAGEIPIRDN